MAVGDEGELRQTCRVQYGVHGFFEEEHFCMSHREDGTTKCSSCERYAPRHAFGNISACLDISSCDTLSGYHWAPSQTSQSWRTLWLP